MKQYLELIQTIKQEGTVKPAARENMPGTTSLFGYQFRHNLAEGFPLLTTKKLNFKHIIIELLWFLRGDTNVKYLVDNGCNIWNQDAYNYYTKKCKENKLSPITFINFVNHIKTSSLNSDLKHIFIPDYYFGDCGVQYGKLWRDLNGVDQISDLIKGLKNNPMSRRHIIDAWNPSTLNDMALNACHCLVQFNCRPLTDLEIVDWKDKNTNKSWNLDNVPKYYLDCQMYQRSADVFLGVPFNIASYALLTEMLSKLCNMVPGDFVHSFGDVHIYDNHNDQINEQLKREPTSLPTLKIEDEGNDWAYIRNTNDFSMLNTSDFSLEGYNPQARIKGKLSTGLN